MKRKRYTEEQIIQALKEAEAGIGSAPRPDREAFSPLEETSKNSTLGSPAKGA